MFPEGVSPTGFFKYYLPGIIFAKSVNFLGYRRSTFISGPGSAKCHPESRKRLRNPTESGSGFSAAAYETQLNPVTESAQLPTKRNWIRSLNPLSCLRNSIESGNWIRSAAYETQLNPVNWIRPDSWTDVACGNCATTTCSISRPFEVLVN